ncbi:MAG: ABC transporter permease [Planctomycetes bacterium]|nr:ABC transporter permease [Planctomycetota bacterium]
MNNPVLARELRLLLRNTLFLKRLFWGWLLLAAVILCLWPDAGIYSSRAQSSRLVFKAFAFGQLFLILLVSPSITAPLITEEKERQRFGMLFASLLTPMDILLGKWLGSLCLQFIILLSSLPFLLLTMALGGVSYFEILQVYLIFIASMFQFGLLGLFFSCVRDRTYNALMLSYAWLLVLVAATWMPSYLLGGFKFMASYLIILRSLSPFAAMMGVVSPDVLILLGSLPKWDFLELWSSDLLVFFAASFSMSAFFFLFCWRKVLLLPLGRDHSSRSSEKDARKKKFPYYVFNPDKRRSPFGIWSLVRTRELRCKMFSYIGNLIRGVYVGLGVSCSLVILVTINVGSMSIEAVRIVAVLFQMVIILLMTPALSASAVSDEYNSGTLEMLRMTPLTSYRFLLGKIQSVILYMLIMLLSSCPVYVLFIVMEYMTKGDPFIVLNIAAIQTSFLVLCSLVGLWCSSLTLNTQKATGMAYLLLFILVGVPFLASSLPIEGSMLDWILSISPFVTCIREASIDLYKSHVLLDRNLAISGGIILLLALHSMIRINNLMRQAR